MDQKAADAFADAWLDAWNRHDIDAILAHYAEDVEFISPFVARLLGEPTGVLRGKTALGSYFERGLAAYPTLRFELERALPGVRSVTLLYQSVNALAAAETMELDSDGRIVRVLAHYAPAS